MIGALRPFLLSANRINPTKHRQFLLTASNSSPPENARFRDTFQPFSKMLSENYWLSLKTVFQ